MYLSVGLRSIAGTALGSMLLSSLGGWIALPGMAQDLPACEPPRASEYLLLVLNQSPETEAQLTELLPENAAISPCNYLDENVVRVGGFASAEIANAWAQYVNDTAGLQAFVAFPSVTSAIAPSSTLPEESSSSEPAAEPSAASDTASSFPTPTQLPESPPSATLESQPNGNGFPSPTQIPAQEPIAPSTAVAPMPSSTSQGYNPQPLGEGYAVLVNYFNRPEVAADIRQVTAQSVGLVAYEQNPFLLATHTPDSETATALLQTLRERGFTAIMVDGRRAILLTPFVLGSGE